MAQDDEPLTYDDVKDDPPSPNPEECNVRGKPKVWEIHIQMPSKDCPYRYFPANIVGCKRSQIFEGEKDHECCIDLCPLMVEDPSYGF